MAPACSAPGARRLLLPLLFLALLSSTMTMPAPSPPAPDLSPVHRIATYDDIPSSYASIYKINPSCPDAVTFGQNTVDERQVALLPMSSIQEDGILCQGSSQMSIVSEATVEEEGLLTGLTLSGFRAALDANTNANNLINVSNTTMMIGWHAAARTCGPNVYTPTTIYFIIKEDTPYTLSFKKGEQTDTITIPPFLRSLLMISTDNTDNKVCLLVDPSSNASANPTVATDDGSGNTVTTVLVPAGSSPAPDGSTGDAPASASPVPASAPGAPPSASPVPAPASGPPAVASPSAGVGVTAPTVAPPSASPVPPSVSAVLSPSAGVSGGAPGETDGETDPVSSVEPVPSDELGTDGAATGADPDDGTATDDGAASMEPDVTDVVLEPPQDDGSACFPGSAVVEVHGGTKRSMKELAVGDRVADGEDGFSDVIFFTHRERRSRNAFLRFTTVSGRKLTVSPGHYVYANGGSLRAAESLVIGEGLDLAERVSSPIVFVEDVSAQGLYNPQTAAGSLVVDGFKVSTYTTAVHPTLAHHVFMAPVRWLYTLSAPLAAALAGAFDEGSPLLAKLLPSGPTALVVPQ